LNFEESDMTTDALLAYFHFAAMIGMAAMLAAEFAALSEGAAPGHLRRLKRLDGLYGLFALLTLVSGVARLLWGAKGSAFYLGNPVFHVKIGLFVLVGLVSIYPTIQYFQWTDAATGNTDFAPPSAVLARIRSLIITQFVVLASIPLAATLMARGIGMN
jgi:putative membrane protein